PKSRDAVKQIKDMKNQVEETRQLEQELSAQPNNLQLAMQLAKAYASRQRVDALDNLVNQLVAHPELPPGEFLQLANLYGSLNRVDRLLALLGMFTQRYPQNPSGWYNLACVQSLRNNCGESIPALQRAVCTASNHKLPLVERGDFDGVTGKPKSSNP